MSIINFILQLVLVVPVLSHVVKVPSSLTNKIDEGFNISVIHLNDFHARFDEVNQNSVTCANGESNCIGGIARVYSVVTQLLQERPNSIFLNAGDNYQGTLWYNIFKWNVTQEFLNRIPTDAYTIGNHDFDDAIAGLVPFLKMLNAPVVVANIDASDEPDMQGLLNKSIVINRNGIRIGIIGVILQTTPSMAATENLKFLPESASVNEEADRLVANDLVDTIIVVSHCGYEREIAIARNATSKISLVVGAHSHTFLYTGNDSPGPDTPAGDYPTVITQSDGRKILVVQASAYTKYLGNITVFYDKNGDVVEWEGAPIFLNASYKKDETIENALQPWKEIIDSYGSVVVGETLINLPTSCYSGECVMGSFVADGYAASYKGADSTQGKYPPLGFINAGGVRASLSAGRITYANAAEVQPFGNTCDYGHIRGSDLQRALEQTNRGGFLQVSGLRLNYTSSSARNLLSAEVYCARCETPGYVPLDYNETYIVVFPSFFKNVGRFSALYSNMEDYTIGEEDITAFVNHINNSSPITNVEAGRINFVSDWDSGSGSRIMPSTVIIFLSSFVIFIVRTFSKSKSI
ncbi:apyrase-like [Agrilus planipennis]|uniref:Apyrase-like n=1 Tax=Agrilus planipennis TaxID=224129 RepID=A0A1W4WET2_AGRPL|nr:apyrase-like [Agrilus planipennis]